MDVSISEDELVAHLSREAAVQFSGEGHHVIAHGIHVVREGESIFARTVECSVAEVVVARVAVRGVPLGVLGHVETEHQPVVVIDIPVQTSHNLVIVVVES